jgi:uncharacterized protein (DUF433 family)
MRESDKNAGISLIDMPGIERVSGVSGGDPVIAGTRIPVWLLVQERQMGFSDTQLLYDYPSLRAEDLANAWAYYTHHKEEIERQIADNENAE